MFCTTESCTNFTRNPRVNYCSSCESEQRKKIRDEEKEKHKRSRAIQVSERMAERARAKQRANSQKDSEGLRRKDIQAKGGGKPIRTRSLSRAKQERQYNKRVKEWLLEHEMCQVCNESPATECHHQKGREGNRLLDERYWLPVCRSCHHYITTDSAEAIRQGYSLPRNH